MRHVQGDTPVEAYLAESVPYINAPAAWNLGYRGDGQTIADIDTGIDWTHPMLTNDPALPPGDLHPKVKYYLCLTAGACTDDFGHGTHVAGIAAGDKTLGYSATPVSGVEVEAGKALYNGVAPKALLWGYKVLATVGTSSAPALSVNLLGATGVVTSTLAIATGTAGSLAGTLTIPAGVAQVSVTLSGFSATDLAPTGTAIFDNVLVY